MKKTLSLMVIMTLFTMNTFSQERFSFTKNGFNDFVVVEIDSCNQNELYNKTLNWIQKTYKNPQEVLLGQIQDEYIRFEGFQSSGLCVNALGMITCYNLKYQIEVHFKDGKYKFKILRIETYAPPTQYTRGGWSDFPIGEIDYSVYYKKSGQIKPTYQYYPTNLEGLFNGLSEGLKSFINTPNSSIDNDW